MMHGWQKSVHVGIPLAGGEANMCMRGHGCMILQMATMPMMTMMITLNINARV